MGNGASAGIAAATLAASCDELCTMLRALPADAQAKIRSALDLAAPGLTGDVLLTSNGLSTAELELDFMRIILGRKGVTVTAEELADPEANSKLKTKYSSILRGLKVLVLSEAAFFMDPDVVAEYYEKHKDAFFHLSLSFPPDKIGGFGLPPENITHVTLWEKPWIMTGGACGYAPGVATRAGMDVCGDDVKPYLELLAKVETRYKELKCGTAPKDEEPQLASLLFAESARLNDKYGAQTDEWLRKAVAENDLIINNGGDVVIGNLSHQINRRVSDAIIAAVRSGDVMYVGRSAGTMVAMKSIECSKEVDEVWLSHLSCTESYAKSSQYSAVDLDDVGTDVNVTGALLLCKSALAMRPHFVAKAFSDQVLAMNKAAELEFEKESGKELDDRDVASSKDNFEAAVRLANKVSSSSTQDNPVFLPIWDGQALHCRISSSGEEFFVCGKRMA